MEEIFLSGYCRCLDASRMVTLEKEGQVWKPDCDFESCPYQPACQIAEKIQSCMETQG